MSDPSVPATPPAVPVDGGSEPPPTVLADGDADCAVAAADPGGSGDADEPVASVGLRDRVDPRKAPRPSNDSERLLFRQLYETLIRADCHGRPRAGLAASWERDAAGRAWILTLRADARFSDGSPVTAADVLASWGSDGGVPRQPRVSRLVESAMAVGERAVSITLRGPRGDAPLALAHADLAVSKPLTGSAWPLGTRAARVVRSDPGPAGAISTITLARDTLPPLRFVVSPGDPRDLLDQGVDLLLTRDPAALGYAGTLPQFRSVPLAWQRTHVMLLPGRSHTVPALSDQQRQAIAADAVRGEAEGARGPSWWESASDCESSPARVPGPPPTAPRIVYDAADPVARDLAERLVGLSRVPGPEAVGFLDALLPDRPRREFQRATGLSGEALVQARRMGADAGYVMALDSGTVDPCRDLQLLQADVPWLDPGTIVPMVRTRPRAVVRRGRAGLVAEWDGVLVFTGTDAPR